jgi:hypothetical protein
MILRHGATTTRCNGRQRSAENQSTFKILAVTLQATSLLLATEKTYLVQAKISGANYLNEEAGEDVPTSIDVLSTSNVDTPLSENSPDSDGDLVNVIIGFKNGTTSRMAEQPGLEVTNQFTRVNAEAVRMPRNDLFSLLDNPDIEFVEEDLDMYLYAESVPWGITAIQADITTTPPPDTVNLRPGEGCFRVCVVDSGFYAGHVDLVSLSLLPCRTVRQSNPYPCLRSSCHALFTMLVAMTYCSHTQSSWEI